MKPWMKLALGVVLGGSAGFAYYYFVGCKTGTCPITSSPVISTLYGSAMGLLLGWPSKKKTANKQSDPQTDPDSKS